MWMARQADAWACQREHTLVKKMKAELLSVHIR